jgi:hypothetical protein
MSAGGIVSCLTAKSTRSAPSRSLRAAFSAPVILGTVEEPTRPVDLPRSAGSKHIRSTQVQDHRHKTLPVFPIFRKPSFICQSAPFRTFPHSPIPSEIARAAFSRSGHSTA